MCAHDFLFTFVFLTFKPVPGFHARSLYSTSMKTQPLPPLPNNLPEKLLDWYDKNHRSLPWRVDPLMRQNGQKPNPYHVWLSEIMLQQTTVATVKDYFNKFIKLWPDIHALSAASLEDMLKNWAGLGYYARARNLKTTANKIASLYNGNFPYHYEALRALPGIGDYTARAIMAIAYDKPYAVIDGNVERIMARLLALDMPKQAAKKYIQQYMETLTPQWRAGDFAQSMMDLGSLICRPAQPACPRCPWQENCAAARRDETDKFPRKTPKAPKPLRTGLAFVIRSKQGHILLQKREKKGLLAAMSEVPNHFGEHVSKNALEHAPYQGAWQYHGEITHIFTHFRLEMAVYFLDDAREDNFVHGWWVKQDQLVGEALPTLIKKVLALVFPAAFTSGK